MFKLKLLVLPVMQVSTLVYPPKSHAPIVLPVLILQVLLLNVPIALLDHSVPPLEARRVMSVRLDHILSKVLSPVFIVTSGRPMMLMAVVKSVRCVLLVSTKTLPVPKPVLIVLLVTIMVSMVKLNVLLVPSGLSRLVMPPSVTHAWRVLSKPNRQTQSVTHVLLALWLLVMDWANVLSVLLGLT
jgi:hypothetical protein